MSIYLLQTINGIGIGMLYFLLAVGLSIVFGLLRFVNFAHGAFYLIGAYFCYQMTRWGWSFWWTLLLAPLAVGAIGWLTEKLLLRHVYASETSALQGAKAAWEKIQRGVAEFSITLAEGRPELFPELPAKVKGFKPLIDACGWTLAKVTHSLSNSSYTAALELEMKLEDMQE